MYRFTILTTLVLTAFAGEALAQAERENTPRACQDGIDNDGDGYVDCSDFDCRPLRFCVPVRPENTLSACRDGIDNDQDGRIDCADDDCMALAFCARRRPPPLEPLPEPGDREDTLAECQDRRDNDRDRRVDCRDPDCCDFTVCPEPRAGRTAAAERTLELCQDHSDNDADGTVDCDDPACQVFEICAPDDGGPVAPPPPPTSGGHENTAALCDDGRDNDGDGDLDCADSECASLPVCSDELPPPPGLAPEDTTALCTDGGDDDADGLVDCEDPDCTAVPACAAPPPRPTARLRVLTEPPGATVLIDGHPVGTTPFEGSGPAGDHMVRIESAGYEAIEQSVRLEAGAPREELYFNLVPLSDAEEPVPARGGRLGWLTFGVGAQVPFLMFGEASTMSAAGVTLPLRLLFAAVRSPIIFDIGIQLTPGYMAGAEYPTIVRAGRELETNDFYAFFDAKYFTAGLFLGLTIPVVRRDRPIVALTLHTTQAVSVYPFEYVMDVALGFSYFATELVELRFELLGLQLWYSPQTWTWEPDDREGTEAYRDLLFVHLAPSIGVHLRF